MPYRPNGEHARLAIGGFGLAGLPVHGVGLDRKPLQSTQCVEATLRGDRLINEFARRLSLRRRGLTYGSSSAAEIESAYFITDPPTRFPWPPQLLSLLAFQMRAPHKG